MIKKALFVALGIFIAPNTFAVNVGDTIPDCSLTVLKGQQPHHLHDYRGKVVYIDFWASWCNSCMQSFPFLNELEKTHQENLSIIGINLDEKVEDANTFLTKFPAQFIIAADKDEQCAKSFDVQAMPSSYLIDKKGIVRHISQGFHAGETDELRKKIAQLLAEK